MNRLNTPATTTALLNCTATAGQIDADDTLIAESHWLDVFAPTEVLCIHKPTQASHVVPPARRDRSFLDSSLDSWQDGLESLL